MIGSPISHHSNWPGFETEAKAQEEDLKRAKVLAKSIKSVRRNLGQKLRESSTGIAFRSLASSVHFRQLRIEVVGKLLTRTASYSDADLVFFTIIRSDWVVSYKGLSSFDPRRIRNAVRQLFRRRGILKHRGCLFVYVHGEFRRPTKTFHLHVHGIGSGEIAKCLRKLSKGFKDKGPYAVKRPFQTDPIENRPRQFTYAFQSWWPMKVGRARERIPPRFEMIYLRWLDQRNLGDLTFSKPPILKPRR